MCNKINSEEIKSENKENIKPVEVPVEINDELPLKSSQGIGHVPIPGSGTGKGTSVKK